MRRESYDLLAIGDAGRLLGLSGSALRNWVNAGELKCFVASDGSRLFTEKHLEEFKRRMEKRKAARLKAVHERRRRRAAEALRRIEQEAGKWKRDAPGAATTDRDPRRVRGRSVVRRKRKRPRRRERRGRGAPTET